MSTARLDVELVRRGLARARGQAEEMVRAGRVRVDGRTATKAALRVADTASIDVQTGPDRDWVGRGARKLDGLLDDLAGGTAEAAKPGALATEAGKPAVATEAGKAAVATEAGKAAVATEAAKPGAVATEAGKAGAVATEATAAAKPGALAPSSGRSTARAGGPGERSGPAQQTEPAPDAPAQQGPRIVGRRCLDAGASTGGFTQVLLDRGAREVVAVDVGHGQLAQELREDPRVHDHPGTSVRGLDPADVGGPADLLVADLSFISLQVVLADLTRLVVPGGDLLLLVKPQFEVGRRRLGSGGVVRDPGLRTEAVHAVATAALDLGLVVRAVRASGWPGPSGNVEYFLWLTLPSGLSAPDDTVDPLARGAAVSREVLADVVRAAVEKGPS